MSLNILGVGCMWRVVCEAIRRDGKWALPWAVIEVEFCSVIGFRFWNVLEHLVYVPCCYLGRYLNVTYLLFIYVMYKITQMNTCVFIHSFTYLGCRYMFKSSIKTKNSPCSTSFFLSDSLISIESDTT